MAEAYSLLKEQEAVEPVKQVEQTEYTVCGNCRNHLISKWIFCPYCGKRVKWVDIREIDGLWCDDITFCQEQCRWESCPRNSRNIRDWSIPHSFSVEIPQDCPKKQAGR